MTIGSFEHSHADADMKNPEFDILSSCRLLIAQTLNVDTLDLELSAGMSDDFTKAIEQIGSTNVRVGSRIFGART